MKRLLVPLLIGAMTWVAPVRSEDTAEPTKATLTRIGQEAPNFAVTTLDGEKFSLKEQRGKVVLVNFFATWCGPCVGEMPHLEREIWQKYKDRKFAMIAVGREHSNAEIKPFREKHKLTFPMAGDPKREAFSRYAEAYIPRTVLINAEGRIVAQVVGYDESEFRSLIKALDAELSRLN